MLIENFNIFQIGNILCAFLFLLTLIFSIINLFSKVNHNAGTLIALIIVSLLALITLSLSGLSQDKDLVLIFSAASLSLFGYLLISLILITFSRSKRIHLFSTGFASIFIAFILFVLNVIQIYYYKDNSADYKNSNLRADAGVILGAAVWGGRRPSPVFRERINKGYELYEMKIVPKLVLTGGGSPDELVKYGVPDNNLFMDVSSTSTIEQIKYVRDNLYKKLKWKKVLIISDNFHLFRSKQICVFNNINADMIATDMPLSTEGYLNFCIKESVAVLFFWFLGIG